MGVGFPNPVRHSRESGSPLSAALSNLDKRKTLGDMSVPVILPKKREAQTTPSCLSPNPEITVQTAPESFSRSLIRCLNPSGGSDVGVERNRFTVARSVFTKALQSPHFSK